MTVNFSVIVPVKNEEGNISHVIRDLDAIFEKSEFLVVVGECSDNTQQFVNSIDMSGSTNVLNVMSQDGIGKGGAIWTGVIASVGETILLYDGDRTIPAIDAQRVAVRAKENGGLVIAERLQLRQKSAMPLTNYLYNRIMARLFALVFGTSCVDLFAGCKAFQSTYKNDLYFLRNVFSCRDHWSDLQLLSAACQLKLEILSIPVNYHRRVSGTSKIIKTTDGLDLLLFILESAVKKIFYSLKN